MELKRASRRSNDREGPRSLARVAAARRRLEDLPRTRGRVWINGREVGGEAVRYGHLGRSYD